MQRSFHEEREHDREVVADRPDDEQHHERDPQLGHAGDVPQAGAHLAGSAGGHGDDAQFRRSHHAQRDEDGNVGDRVDREAPPVADGHDEQAGDGRPDDARDIDHRAVDRHRVGQVFHRDHLVDERAPHGVVDGQEATADRGRHEERAERCVGHEGERRQHERLAHLEALSDVEQPALVAAVDDGAGPRREQEDRSELARGERADRHAAARPVEDEQRERNERQPVAGVGDGLAEEEQPEVARSQRRQRAPDEARFRRGDDDVVFDRHRGQMLCARRSMSGAAARSCSSSGRVNSFESARASSCVRALRRSRRICSPALVIDISARRPSAGSGRRSTSPRASSAFERRAHRLWADLFELGEPGRGRGPASIEAREGRGLRQRELAFDLLTEPPHEHADAHPERGCHPFDLGVGLHILSLN